MDVFVNFSRVEVTVIKRKEDCSKSLLTQVLFEPDSPCFGQGATRYKEPNVNIWGLWKAVNALCGRSAESYDERLFADALADKSLILMKVDPLPEDGDRQIRSVRVIAWTRTEPSAVAAAAVRLSAALQVPVAIDSGFNEILLTVTPQDKEPEILARYMYETNRQTEKAVSSAYVPASAQRTVAPAGVGSGSNAGIDPSQKYGPFFT
jgi:hypothetical protein